MSRLRQQRRGKGSSNYRNHKSTYSVKYINCIDEKNYKLIKILKDPLKKAPIGLFITNEGEKFYNILPIKIHLGAEFSKDTLLPGKISRLKHIPTGTYVYNLENIPNQGGKLIRAPGVVAQIMKLESQLVYLKLKARIISLPFEAYGTIGIVGGGGHILKPILKAGTSYKMYKNKAKKSKTVSAKNKNHHEHPFGASKSKSPGRPKTCSRDAPPGAKVGSIAASRTGRKSR
jgi:large subunit ribosomal protein L2